MPTSVRIQSLEKLGETGPFRDYVALKSKEDYMKQLETIVNGLTGLTGGYRSWIGSLSELLYDSVGESVDLSEAINALSSYKITEESFVNSLKVLEEEGRFSIFDLPSDDDVSSKTIVFGENRPSHPKEAAIIDELLTKMPEDLLYASQTDCTIKEFLDFAKEEGKVFDPPVVKAVLNEELKAKYMYVGGSTIKGGGLIFYKSSKNGADDLPDTVASNDDDVSVEKDLEVEKEPHTTGPVAAKNDLEELLQDF